LLSSIDEMAALNPDQFQQLLNQLGGGGGNKRKLPAFASGDANAWLEWKITFTNVAALNQWDDAMAKRQLKAAMEGFAATAVAHVELTDEMTQADALTAYERKFVTPANSAAARQQFLTARQREDETLVAWHTRVMALYRRSDPEVNANLSRELRERFIMGLAHPTVKERTYDANPENMEQALTVASDKFATIAAAGADRAAVSLAHRMGINNMQLPAGSGSALEQKRFTTTLLRCYICNSAEHLKRDCPRNNGKGNFTNKRKNTFGGKGGRKPGSSNRPFRRQENNNGNNRAAVPFRIQAMEEQKGGEEQQDAYETTSNLVDAGNA
jgi:hypothetical protein